MRMACYGQLISIKKDGSEGAEFQVTKNEISVGSLASCDLRLLLPGVEQIHCSFLVHLNSSALLRNFSTNNPVEVNGKPILKNAILEDGDKVSILSKTFLWRSCSFEVNKASRKSIATSVRSPGNVRSSGRRKSEPILKLVAAVSPVRRSIDTQSPGFSTRRSPSQITNAAETSEGVTEDLSRNVTVRRKANTRVSSGSSKRWSRGGNRKSILRTAATPRANKSVRFNRSLNETSPEHAIWNVPRTPANTGFRASELSSTDSGSLSLIDLTNLSSSDFTEDISKISEYLSTPGGRSFKSESEPETTPQSSRVGVRFDESSARALLSPFNARKSSVRQPATPYVRSATKPLISFETPSHSLEVSSLISFETPVTASACTSDTSLISFETPVEAGSVSEMKSTAQREKTPFRVGSSTRLKPTSTAKSATGAFPGQSNPARTKLLASPKLKVETKMPNKPKPKDQTPRRSTQLIRLKKKPAPTTPVLNLGEVFKTPGKQRISANAKLESKKQTPARLPVINIKEETPSERGLARTPAMSMKGFSPAHLHSHLKNSPKIGTNLRNGMSIGKTRGTYFPVNYNKRTPKTLPAATKSKTPLKFIPKSMFTHKFTTPAKVNVGTGQNRSTVTNQEIAGDNNLNDFLVEPSTSGMQTVNGEASLVKTPESTRVTRRSVVMPENTSKTPVMLQKLGAPARNCSSDAESPNNLTFTEIDIATPEGDVISDASAVGTVSKYSPGQTIADLDFTNDPSVLQNLSTLQNSDFLLNTPNSSRVTRKSVKMLEESRLENSSADVPETPRSCHQKLGTSASPFVNRSNVFKTPMKTPAKNTRSSTAKKTPVKSDASKRSKTLLAQSTPNADKENLSVSLAFSDVCQTPLKTPVGTFDTVNDAVTMSGSDLDGTLKTQRKSHSRSLRSTVIDDATVTISASGFNGTFDTQQSTEWETSARSLNKTADKIKRPLSQNFNATYELVNSPEEWHDLSLADKSTRKSKNDSTFDVSSKSLAYTSSRIASNSTARSPRKSLLPEGNDVNTSVTRLTDLTGTSFETSRSRVTRNSTFNASKTLPTPSAHKSSSRRHSSSHASVPVSFISDGALQTSGSKIELDYDESVLNVTKSPSKSSIKRLRSSSVNEMSVTARSNLDVSSEKLTATECGTSARKTRSRSNLSGVKSLNKTYSPEKSLLTPGITRKSCTYQQIMQTSVESDFSNSDESEVETSSEGNITDLQCEDEQITRSSTLRLRSKTPSKTRVENSNSVVVDLPDSPDLNLDEVFKTPLKLLATKPKTPALKQNEPVSPMLDLGGMFKTPSKTPAKMTRSSTSVLNVSTKTPGNMNSVATEVDGDSILPASNTKRFEKIPSRFTTKAVSPGIAAKADDLFVNANLYETELDYEESFLPANGDGKLQTPLKTPAKQANNSSIVNDTPLKTLASTSGKKSRTPNCIHSAETESVAKVVSSAKLENSLSSRPVNTSSGIKDVTMSPLLNLVDIFGTPMKTPKTPVSIDVNRLKSNSTATKAFDFGKLISSALNTANDVENTSFSSPLKSAALYASLNRSAGSPLTEVSVFQMLNKSNNTNTPAKLNRSSTKENFNPVTSPKPRDSAKSLKNASCEGTPKTCMPELLSENENTSSGLSSVPSVTFFEPSPARKPAKSARKSSSISFAEKTTSSPEVSFTNIAAVELTALSADGGKLRSKVMKPNAVSPILLDKLFEKSRSKLQSPPGSNPQSSKVASCLDTVSELNTAKSSDVQIPAAKFNYYCDVKTLDPKDVLESSIQSDSEFSVPSSLEALPGKRWRRASFKPRKSNDLKSAKRRSSESFSRRSSGNSSTFTVTKKRLSTGKVPKRNQKLRFHPDVLSTPEIEQTSREEFSDEEETVKVRRSTRKSTLMPTRSSRRSNRSKNEAEEEVPKETNIKPAKKTAKAPQPKPVSKQTKKASTKTAVIEKPVVPTKRTKLSVEPSDILEPQRQTRRATRAKPEVESQVVEKTSPAGKKRKSIQTQAAKTGAKRKKATVETEEIEPMVPRQRRTRAVTAEKPETGKESATKQEETEPEKKNKRQMRQRGKATETEENAGPSRGKTKSKINETYETEQVEQRTSRRKTRSAVESEASPPKRRARGVVETAEKIVPTQTNLPKRKTRAAAKTTDEAQNESGETAAEAASTQRKTRSRVTAKKTAVKAASEEVSPIKKTRAKISRKSVLQQTEELPSRRKTAKVASETATRRVLKKVQTPSPLPKKRTRSTNPVAGTSKENQENVAPLRKTRSNVKSQKRVSVGKTGRASPGRRVTRSRK